MRRRSVIKAIGVAGTVGLAGCQDGGAGDGGSDGDTDGADGGTTNGGDTPVVTIGTLSDLSGPSTDVGIPLAAGRGDILEYINQEDLLDADLDVSQADYGYDVAEARSLYDEYREDGAEIIMGYGTPDTEALAPLAAEDEILFVAGSTSEFLGSPDSPWSVIDSLDYTSQARVLMEWIAENDSGAKVSVISPDNEYGRTVVEPGYAYAEELGLETGEWLALEFQASSAESQLRRAEEEGVDYLIHHGTATPMQVLMADKESVYPEVEVMATVHAFTENLAAEFGSTADGVLYSPGHKTFPHALESDRIGAILRSVFENRDESVEDTQIANINYMRGVSNALVAYKAIDRAIEMGLDPSDSNNIREGLLTIENRDTWNVHQDGANYTFTEEDHRPTMTGGIYESQGGEVVFDEAHTLPRRTEWIE